MRHQNEDQIHPVVGCFVRLPMRGGRRGRGTRRGGGGWGHYRGNTHRERSDPSGRQDTRSSLGCSVGWLVHWSRACPDSPGLRQRHRKTPICLKVSRQLQLQTSTQKDAQKNIVSLQLGMRSVAMPRSSISAHCGRAVPLHVLNRLLDRLLENSKRSFSSPGIPSPLPLLPSPPCYPPSKHPCGTYRFGSLRRCECRCCSSLSRTTNETERLSADKPAHMLNLVLVVEKVDGRNFR